MDTYQHVLVVEDRKGRRAINLEASCYSIGRDPVNAIQLDSEDVSRQHAFLVRLPSEAGFKYQLVDGSVAGKPSRNGTRVRDQLCKMSVLKDGDVIQFGSLAKASYYLRQLSSEHLHRYTQTPPVRSLKVTPIGTKTTLTLQPA